MKVKFEEKEIFVHPEIEEDFREHIEMEEHEWWATSFENDNERFCEWWESHGYFHTNFLDRQAERGLVDKSLVESYGKLWHEVHAPINGGYPDQWEEFEFSDGMFKYTVITIVEVGDDPKYVGISDQFVYKEKQNESKTQKHCSESI